eukprot:5637096-Amphidinium_carterae.1
MFVVAVELLAFVKALFATAHFVLYQWLPINHLVSLATSPCHKWHDNEHGTSHRTEQHSLSRAHPIPSQQTPQLCLTELAAIASVRVVQKLWNQSFGVHRSMQIATGTPNFSMSRAYPLGVGSDWKPFEAMRRGGAAECVECFCA